MAIIHEAVEPAVAARRASAGRMFEGRRGTRTIEESAEESLRLFLKDVPEEIAEALRQRAARNHRSLQGELMAIIQAAVQAGDARGLPANWGAFDGRRGTRTIEDLIGERRQKYPEPVRGGPLGVDIIRADRDSR